MAIDVIEFDAMKVLFREYQRAEAERRITDAMSVWLALFYSPNLIAKLSLRSILSVCGAQPADDDGHICAAMETARTRFLSQAGLLDSLRATTPQQRFFA